MYLRYVVVFLFFLTFIANSQTTFTSALSALWRNPYKFPSTTNTTTTGSLTVPVDSLFARFDRRRRVEGRCMFCDAELANRDATLRFENLPCINWEWMAPDYTAEEAVCLIVRAGAVASCGCPIANAYSSNADDNNAMAPCDNLCVEDYQEVNRLKPIEIVPLVTCGDIESFPAVDGSATCDLFRREIAPICCINRTKPTTNVEDDDDDNNNNNNNNNNNSNDKNDREIPRNNNSQQSYDATNPSSSMISTLPQVVEPHFGVCKFCDDMGSLDRTLRLENIPCIEWSWFANFATEDQCLFLRAGAVQACGCPLVDHTAPCTNICMEGQVLNGTKTISLVGNAPPVTCEEVASYPAVDGTQTCDYFRRAIAPLCCTDTTGTFTTNIAAPTDFVETETDPSSIGSVIASSLFDIPSSSQAQSWLGVCRFCEMYSRLLDTNLTFQHTPCITWDLLAGFATQEQCLILRAGAVQACGCPIDSANNAPCHDICGSDDQVINSTKPIGLIDNAPHITCGDVASYPAVDGTATCDYFRQAVAPICCVAVTTKDANATTDSTRVSLPSSIQESIAPSSDMLESAYTLVKPVLSAETLQPFPGVCKICDDNSHLLDANLGLRNLNCFDWVWFATFATEEQCPIVRAGAAEPCACPIDSANVAPCEHFCTDDQVINTTKIVRVREEAPSITCGDIASYPAVDGTATCDYFRREVAPICCMDTTINFESQPTHHLSSTSESLTSLNPDPLPQTTEPWIGGCKFCDTESVNIDPTRKYENIYCIDWDWFISNAPREECLIVRAGAVEACGCPVNAINNAPCENFCSENQIVNRTKRIGLVTDAPRITCGEVALYPAVDGTQTCEFFREEIAPICCINATHTSDASANITNSFSELEDLPPSLSASTVDTPDIIEHFSEEVSDTSVDNDKVVSFARGSETDSVVSSYNVNSSSKRASWRFNFFMLQVVLLYVATI